MWKVCRAGRLTRGGAAWGGSGRVCSGAARSRRGRCHALARRTGELAPGGLGDRRVPGGLADASGGDLHDDRMAAVAAQVDRQPVGARVYLDAVAVEERDGVTGKGRVED